MKRRSFLGFVGAATLTPPLLIKKETFGSFTDVSYTPDTITIKCPLHGEIYIGGAVRYDTAYSIDTPENPVDKLSDAIKLAELHGINTIVFN